MTRCIAILTLALTAAVSADETFAIDPGDCSSALRTGVMIVDQGGGDGILLHCDTLTFGLIAITGDVDHPNTLEFSLIAIIAFEDSPEAAYEMLLDLGLSPAMAENMVLEAIAIYGVRRY